MTITGNRYIEIMEPRKEAGWCGPATLHHVGKCFGVTKYSQEDIAKAIGTDDNGTTIEQMLKGVEILGLKGEWKVLTFEDLEKYKSEGAQIIVSWMEGSDPNEDGHYSVFEDYAIVGGQECIVLNDPDWIGLLKVIKKKSFYDVWYDIENGKREYYTGIVVTKD
jgi:predicted double-glycine peptidase